MMSSLLMSNSAGDLARVNLILEKSLSLTNNFLPMWPLPPPLAAMGSLSASLSSVIFTTSQFCL